MGATTKTGFYSKDVPPPIVHAPPRGMVKGLAPWLHQATNTGSAGLPQVNNPNMGAWYSQQVAQAEAANKAAAEQRKQAELLRQQEAMAAAAAAEEAKKKSGMWWETDANGVAYPVTTPSWRDDHSNSTD